MVHAARVLLPQLPAQAAQDDEARQREDEAEKEGHAGVLEVCVARHCVNAALDQQHEDHEDVDNQRAHRGDVAVGFELVGA